MNRRGMAKQKLSPDEQAKMIADQGAKIAEWGDNILKLAGSLRLKSKVVDSFVPEELERVVLPTLSTLPVKLRTKAQKTRSSFTVAEIVQMTTAISVEFSKAEPQQQVGLLMVAKTLMDAVHDFLMKRGEAAVAERPQASSVTKLYQFKITLLDSEPPIWRRIQIQDCTLDELHEHIQTAMGWTNSHLHQFEIDGERYGDPELLNDDFGDVECEDSTRMKLSEILPVSGKRFRFMYEYDFGDGWQHEIFFEGCPVPEKRKKYPLCLEGERACPPEDVGGVWGYAELLEALGDPQHERHDELMEWAGSIEPDKFNAATATKRMKEGVPNWRD